MLQAIWTVRNERLRLYFWFVFGEWQITAATIRGWCLPSISISHAFPVRAACSKNIGRKSVLSVLFNPSAKQNVKAGGRLLTFFPRRGNISTYQPISSLCMKCILGTLMRMCSTSNFAHFFKILNRRFLFLLYC